MGKYNIERIHYRDKFGKLLFDEPVIFKRLHGPDKEIVMNHIWYKIISVAVADNIQHVNMVEGRDE